MPRFSKSVERWQYSAFGKRLVARHIEWRDGIFEIYIEEMPEITVSATSKYDAGVLLSEKVRELELAQL